MNTSDNNVVDDQAPVEQQVANTNANDSAIAQPPVASAPALEATQTENDDESVEEQDSGDYNEAEEEDSDYQEGGDHPVP